MDDLLREETVLDNVTEIKETMEDLIKEKTGKEGVTVIHGQQ